MSTTTNVKGNVKASTKATTGKPVIPVVWYDGKGKPEAERDGDKVGLTTGLRLTLFANELMRHLAVSGSVTLADGRKVNALDDTALDAILKAEFPKRPRLQSFAAYRSYWNYGQHGHNYIELDPKTGKAKEGPDGKPVLLLPKLPTPKKARVAPPPPPAPPGMGKGK